MNPNTMKPFSYTIGDPTLRVDFRGFKQAYDCAKKINYKFLLSNGNLLPAFIKPVVNNDNSGFLEIQTNKRRDAGEP